MIYRTRRWQLCNNMDAKRRKTKKKSKQKKKTTTTKKKEYVISDPTPEATRGERAARLS